MRAPRIVLGAGAVGLSLGARLAAGGRSVLFVAHGEDAARAIRESGVVVEDPGSGEVVRAAPARGGAAPGVDAAAGIAAAAAALRDPAAGPVLLCVRADDTAAVAAELAAAAPGASVASVQNHVDNEEILARTFPRVLGVVWRQTCTRVAPNAVRALGRGRVVVGAWPEGGGGDVDALAADLRSAGFDVGVSARIVEDKWLKLCVNLMSAPNALVVPDDHTHAAFVEIKVRLLTEARDVLAAAGIPARSCDGGDRSLEEEIAFQRASLARGTSARRLPVYNQIWAALRDRRSLEGHRYHRLLVELGARHGVATPQNARVLEALELAWREGRGPESVRARDLLAG